MEPTQEYLDKKFHEVNQNIKHSTEELARIIATTIAEPMERQFDEIKTLLDTREKVTHMEAWIQQAAPKLGLEYNR
jgi:predicted DNA-binding ArsR family transcriptional regulator